MKFVAALIALSGAAAVVTAQPDTNLPTETQVRFQVWNGSSWSNQAAASPGDQVEFRIVVSYTGSNSSVMALGNARLQPVISNFDNDNGNGSVDGFAAFRNGGVSGNFIAGSMLSQAEGQNGNALPSYGRVFPFGSAAMNGANGNTLTAFRHGGGAPANGAPAGSWARLAGSTVATWPASGLTAAQANAASLNGIFRGLAVSQLSQANAGTAWQGGTQDIVVFRGAVQLSTNAGNRTLILSNAAGSLLRVGGVGSDDDARYVAWQTSTTDNGSYRSAVQVLTGAIVIPTPGGLALLAVGGIAAARRRR
ncbi:MAG TPA: hypothetical protein VD971_07590 [Phycisphaerales bacterium]|nr:hypothetical protein [Phycisphaerales bacterium]